MSTAADIFKSIIDGDNIKAKEYITTELYNRTNTKIENMKEVVGSKLFKEED